MGTGTYSIKRNRRRLPQRNSRPSKSKKGDNLNQSIDLVKETSVHSLSPDQVTAVNSDQPIPDAMKQDAAAKTALTSYYQQTFQGLFAARRNSNSPKVS